MDCWAATGAFSEAASSAVEDVAAISDTFEIYRILVKIWWFWRLSRADLKKKWWLVGADMSLKEDTTTTVAVHHNNDKEEGSKSETSMTYLSFIADGRRLRRGGVVGGGNSGEAVVDNGGCGGVHRRWLKEVRGYLFLARGE
ncbi:unnamed protein product [Lactuca saligna]|uniref:Uncharacterized protein n=1 Tax=Lactuca saligna TaxID=75948 RepID=A0AA35VFW2_LACSI|nr:unnamed protein product [Lactuca saligna]